MTAGPLLFEGKGFMAVDKPAGRLVIPGRGDAGELSLKEELEKELGRTLWVVHRLDRDTSGVLLFALDAAAHRALSMAFEAGRIRKRYLALVSGRVDGPLELKWALVSARRGRMRPARAGEAGKAAHTRVLPVESFATATLVEAEPLTGRQHQIRVHLSAAGHPLWVDRQYGRATPPGPPLLSRTPLHAAALEVPEGEGLEGAAIAAPMPEDMARALDELRAQRST